MIHLRMSGQVLLADDGAERPAAHARRDAPRRRRRAPPHELWFVDPRTFGEVVVFDPDNVAVELPELANLGIDPIADELTLPMLRRLLRSRHRLLKPLLLDQHVIAGIGNIYADEILHEARLRPGSHVRRRSARPPSAACTPPSTVCSRRRSRPADRRSATPSTST